MAKRLSREEKKEKVVVDLLNEMFKFAKLNVTYEDIKDRKDAWYSEYTMTSKQYEDWQKWGVKYLKKQFKLTDVWASREMAMIGLNWGLKCSDFPPMTTQTV
jgi:hypothetical protein